MVIGADSNNKWRVTWERIAPGIWFGLIIGLWYGAVSRNPFANSDQPINWSLISSSPLAPYLLNPRYESFVWSILPLSIIGILYRLPASYLEYITAEKTGLGGIFIRSVLKWLLSGAVGVAVLCLLGLFGAPSINREWTLLYKQLYGFAYVMGAAGMNSAFFLGVMAVIVGVLNFIKELLMKYVIGRSEVASRIVSRVKTFGF